LSALLAFDADAEPTANEERMREAYQAVQSGELTYAIRDSKLNGHEIKKGDYLGIREGKIELVGQEVTETAVELVTRMIGEGADVVTIIYGQDVTADQAEALQKAIAERHPDVEVEVHEGGQPVYYYLFAVE
jgi:dihydroxyacetone kinase-like predicted kinase